MATKMVAAWSAVAVLLLDLIIEFIDTQIGRNADPPSPHMLWKNCQMVASQQLPHNRPFYRYGGHIELIQFKEYYRMPRGHEHISFVF